MCIRDRSSSANLAAPDTLEAASVFARGRASSVGLGSNLVLSRRLAATAGYVNTRSDNTGLEYPGNALPYLPRHLAKFGLNWASDAHWMLGAQALWRAARFSDEANTARLPPGWELALRLHWESQDKRWSVDAYAANLLRRDLANLLGVNAVLRF